MEVRMRHWMLILTTALPVAMTIVSGCTEDAPVKDTKSVAVKRILNPSVRTNDVIACINGVGVTAGDYDNWIWVQKLAYCLGRGLDPTKVNQKSEAYISGKKVVFLNDLVRREVLRQACEKQGIVPPKKYVSEARAHFMSSIRKPKGSFEQFADTLPEPQRTVLIRQVESDARNTYFLEQSSTNDLRNVSDKELSDFIEKVNKYNEEVEAMNVKAVSKAAAAKAEILAGNTFYSVTTNRAEIFQDQGKYWDTVELSDLDPDEELFRFLCSAKEGDISDPLNLDDCIAIVGVLAKEPPTVHEGVEIGEQYSLVRCAFNAYEEADEPVHDPKKMRQSLLDQRVAEAREALMNKVLDDVKIEYPFGNKLFSRGKSNRKHGKKSSKPAPKVQTKQ